jgi:hypothetical protein
MECPTCEGSGQLPYTIAELDKAIGDWEYYMWGSLPTELPGIGTMTRVELHDEEFETACWMVVKIVDPQGNERLFKRNGWRASHDGSCLDGPTVEVRAETKTIQVTTYETVFTEVE